MLAKIAPDRSSVPARQRGLGGVEVIVLVAVGGFLILCVLVALPKGRETARGAACQRNLMQIGVATQLYEQANLHYPMTPPLGDPGGGDSPVLTMLKALTLPDFLDLRDASQPPKPTAPPGRGARVAGLVCPSDPRSGSASAASALSYRANAGDSTDGQHGPFSPGRAVGSSPIDAADGLSFTAGFAERLLGTGRDGEPSPANYALVAGPVPPACDPLSAVAPRWHGDAGMSWSSPGWTAALYSHAATPNAAATCVADDGRTASMTASSPHPGRINVWMLDGSLRGVTPSVAASIWKAMGSTGSPAPPVEPRRP